MSLVITNIPRGERPWNNPREGKNGMVIVTIAPHINKLEKRPSGNIVPYKPFSPPPTSHPNFGDPNFFNLDLNPKPKQLLYQYQRGYHMRLVDNGPLCITNGYYPKNILHQ